MFIVTTENGFYICSVKCQNVSWERQAYDRRWSCRTGHARYTCSTVEYASRNLKFDTYVDGIRTQSSKQGVHLTRWLYVYYNPACAKNFCRGPSGGFPLCVVFAISMFGLARWCFEDNVFTTDNVFFAQNINCTIESLLYSLYFVNLQSLKYQTFQQQVDFSLKLKARDKSTMKDI